MDHWGKTAGIFQTQVAAGYGETHCGWLALRRRKYDILCSTPHVEAMLGRTTRTIIEPGLTDFPSPLPGHPPLAGGTRLVKVTGSTSGLINNCGWLSNQKIKKN